MSKPWAIGRVVAVCYRFTRPKHARHVSGKLYLLVLFTRHVPFFSWNNMTNRLEVRNALPSRWAMFSGKDEPIPHTNQFHHFGVKLWAIQGVFDQCQPSENALKILMINPAMTSKRVSKIEGKKERFSPRVARGVKQDGKSVRARRLQGLKEWDGASWSRRGTEASVSCWPGQFARLTRRWTREIIRPTEHERTTTKCFYCAIGC